MESRRSNRKIVDWPAEIIAADQRYAGSIENISPEGIYIVTAPTQSFRDFAVDSFVNLRFSLPSGENLSLKCRIKWSFQTPPHGYTNSLGLEIIDPPSYLLEGTYHYIMQLVVE